MHRSHASCVSRPACTAGHFRVNIRTTVKGVFKEVLSGEKKCVKFLQYYSGEAATVWTACTHDCTNFAAKVYKIENNTHSALITTYQPDFSDAVP